MSAVRRPASARAAVALSFASKYATVALRAASLLALSRLLGPEDFGVFTVAAAVVSIVFAFAEFGLHSYLVQIPRMTRAAVGAAVGISCALCALALGFVALLGLLAPAGAFGPEARSLMLLLALATAVQPIGLPVTAALHRRLRFDLLMAIDVSRAAAGVAVGVGFAAAGFGAASLAWGALADAAVGTSLGLILGGGRPVRPRLSGWGAALRFGGPLALTGGLRQGGDSGVALLLGGAFGAAAVGLYNRALTVTDTLDKAIVQALSPVVLPVLTREVRRGGALAPLYLRKLAYLSVIHWPFFAVLILLAEPAVRLALGPRWDDAVPLVRALAIAGLFGPFTAVSMKFFVAIGATGFYAKLQLAAVAVKLAAVAALALVSLQAAVFGLVVGAGFRALLITASLERRLGVERRAIAAALARGAAVAALSAAGPALVASLHWSGGSAPMGLPAAALAGSLAVLGWLAGLAATGHEFGAELERLARGALRRTPFPAVGAAAIPTENPPPRRR